MSNILRVQERCMKMGLQWTEHIYNDGLPNCSLKFTTSAIAGYFTSHNILGDFGWGRFSREQCWDYVEDYLNEVERGLRKFPSPEPLSYKQREEEAAKRMAERATTKPRE